MVNNPTDINIVYDEYKQTCHYCKDRNKQKVHQLLCCHVNYYPLPHYFVVGFGRRGRDRTVKIIAFTYNQTYELDSRFLSGCTRYSIKQEVRKLVSNLQQVGGLLSSTCIPACFLHGNKPDHHNPSTEHCLSPISAS
jgi:hypothetical protein